jgi:hypothetical protein
MHFVYPGFLAALAVILIPVLVHLFYFRRYKTIRFSSLRFLRTIETERKNQNKLKHFLLLCSRILAFVFLVLAFSIPSCNPVSTSGVGKTNIRLFIDNSYSMQNKGAPGLLFETAKQKARELVKSAASQSSFSIWSHGNYDQQLCTAQEAISKIDKLEISPLSESAADIWSKFRYVQKQGAIGTDVLCIVSDFQNALTRALPSAENKKSKAVGIQLGYSDFSNISVDTAWLSNPFAGPGETNKLWFKLTNYSNESIEGLNTKLSLENKVLGLTRVNLLPNEAALAAVDFTMPASGSGLARLEIDDAANAFDNVLYVTLRTQKQIAVMVRGSNTYLNSALRTNTFFNVQPWDVRALSFPRIGAVYVQSEVGLSQEEAGKLTSYAIQGGTVIFIPRVSAGKLQFKPLITLSGFPEFEEIKEKGAKVRKEGLSHPFYSRVFSAIPKSIEMPEVNSYFSTRGNTGNGEAILSLENGDPWLLKFKEGKGAIFLFTSAFELENGNVVRSVLFFPTVINCAVQKEVGGQLFGYAASQSGLLLQTEFKNMDGDVMVSRDGKAWTAEIQNGAEGRELYIQKEMHEAGFYKLYSKSNPKDVEYIALNTSRFESNPAKSAASELEKLSKNTGLQWLSPNQTSSVSGNLSDNSSLWRLFIWLAATFFAVEVLIIAFWDSIFQRVKNRAPVSKP